MRAQRPYGAYRLLDVPSPRYRRSGDALARQLVRLDEIWGSFELCRQALDDLAGRRQTAPGP